MIDFWDRIAAWFQGPEAKAYDEARAQADRPVVEKWLADMRATRERLVAMGAVLEGAAPGDAQAAQAIRDYADLKTRFNELVAGLERFTGPSDLRFGAVPVILYYVGIGGVALGVTLAAAAYCYGTAGYVSALKADAEFKDKALEANIAASKEGRELPVPDLTGFKNPGLPPSPGQKPAAGSLLPWLVGGAALVGGAIYLGGRSR